MLLSIITPVFNAERYLLKNMTGIIEQLTDDTELVLVDDGSTDNSGIICDKLKSISYHVKVMHTTNCGVSAARNHGLTIAKGKYITFVDSDDFVTKDYIPTLLSHLKDSADLYLFNSYLLHDSKLEQRNNNLKEGYYDSASLDCVYNLFLCGKSNEPWDKAYKAEIIHRYNLLFDESLNLGEDIVFSLAYLLHIDNANCINRNLYYHNFNKSGLGQTKVSLKTLEFHNKLALALIDFLHQKKNQNINSYNCAYTTILCIIVNCVGKLYSFGYPKQKIKKTLLSFSWFPDILNWHYSGFKNKLRIFTLKYSLYGLISYIFRK